MLHLRIVWDSFPLEDVWLKTIKFLSPLGRNYNLPHFTGNRNVVGNGREKQNKKNKQKTRTKVVCSPQALPGKGRNTHNEECNFFVGEKKISTPGTSRPHLMDLRLDLLGTDCWDLPFCIHLVQEKLVKGKIDKK